MRTLPQQQQNGNGAQDHVALNGSLSEYMTLIWSGGAEQQHVPQFRMLDKCWRTTLLSSVGSRGTAHARVLGPLLEMLLGIPEHFSARSS